MKKIFFILNFSLLAITIFAQSGGDGTSGDPYWGTISSSVTWSTPSTIYVGTSENNDLTIISDGHLTIEPGITVIFTELNTDLLITESGILTADGSSSNKITFTKATGNSHWGHISFETPGTGTPIAGTGSFDYCIVEYGYAATSGTNPDNAGGGIQVNADDVTIDNCFFENNYSNFGGAVTVNAGRNTIISNSIFKSNEVYEAGGAVLLWTNSTARIENCIFENNYSDGNLSSNYSGGAIWLLSNTSKIISCTFVENTSKHPGAAIYSYSSSGSSIVNSILWGSNDQFAGVATSSTITNCAFESAKPSAATNSIIISDDASDHFTDASNGDWSLKFISPCRDAGTTPDPEVPNDYDGNSRIGAYDIGAYEVQYSRWTGETAGQETSWNTATNWIHSILPSTSMNVVIPDVTNDPLISSSDVTITNLITETSGLLTVGADRLLTATKLTNGGSVIFNPQAKGTITTIVNNGTLKLESNATEISSLITNSFSGSDATIELYLTGGEAGSGNYRWHYISSPFYTLPSITPFIAVTQNLAQFIQSLYSSTTQAWVAYDGYNYATGLGGPTFSSLSPGTGYNFYDNVDNEITISGQLQYDDVEVDLDFGDNGPSYSGFNLLGNPFPSGLDWEVIINDASYPDETSKGVYFTRDNAQCSYIGGVGTPVGVTGIIPPMQGFFTKTYNNGNPTLKLLASARTHNSIHARYKGKSEIPLIRLSLTKDSISDETVVRFDEQAKPELDNDFDALKMFLSDEKISIYSFDGETKYAINGQPFPETEVEIPIVVNLISEGDHKISAIQLQGLDNYHVNLKDLVTGFDVDLKTTPELTFTDTAGTYIDRFILTISSTTGIEDIHDLPGLFNVFTTNNLINIRTLSDAWNGKNGTVRIFDLTGRTVSEIHNKEFWKNSILQVPAPSPKGIYFVEIRAGGERYVGKVSVR